MNDVNRNREDHTAEHEPLAAEIETEHQDHIEPTPEDAEQPTKKKGHRQRLWQRWKQGTIQNQLTVIFTALIFVATSVYAIFSYYQFSTMKDSGKQTDRIIAADERLAKAMEDSIANQKDALTQSQTALNSTIAASRLDQRAWVGVTDVHVTIFKPNARPNFELIIINSGKTPALRLWTNTNVQIVLIGHHPEFGKPYMPPGSRGDLQPNAKFTIIAPSRDAEEISKTIYDDVQAGRYVVWLFGTVHYEDVFGTSHWSHFCHSYSRGNTDVCSQFNDSDKGKY